MAATANPNLLHHVPLNDGRELHTTGEAISFIESTPRPSIIADDALALLRRAAASGKLEDLRTATRVLIRVLRHFDMLAEGETRQGTSEPLARSR